jgi:hypothetical protein
MEENQGMTSTIIDKRHKNLNMIQYHFQVPREDDYQLHTNYTWVFFLTVVKLSNNF